MDVIDGLGIERLGEVSYVPRHLGQLAALPVGPLLARRLEWLGSVDLSRAREVDLLDAAVAAHRQVAWSQAQLLRVLSALDSALEGERDAAPDDAAGRLEQVSVPVAGDEFAAAAAVSPAAGDALVRLARTLTERLPRSLDALERGDLDHAKVKAAAAQAHEVSAEAARAVDETAATQGPSRTSRQLQPLLARAALAADPDAARRRRDRARADRHVASYPEPDGMMVLRCVGTAEQVVSIVGVLDAVARGPRADGDHRTLDQRRVDALHAVVTGAIGPDGIVPAPLAALSRMSRPGAEIQVVVDRDALLGSRDTPAHFVGYGPVVADTARDLAGDACWRRLLTDSASGALVEIGTVTYRPSARLRRFVRVRDGCCVFPRCSRPAERCDLDHTRNWPDGPTCPCNMAPLCRRHPGQRHVVRPDPPWRQVSGRSTLAAPATCHPQDPGPPPF